MIAGNGYGFVQRVTTRAHDPGEFVVVEKLQYLSRAGLVFSVERGFITDFASTPWIVQVLPGFDVNGDSREPAVLHDRLYCARGEVEAFDIHAQRWQLLRLSRAECDALFREALLSVGFNGAAVFAYWSGVRAGGWHHWNRRLKPKHPSYDFVPQSYWDRDVDAPLSCGSKPWLI